MLEEEMRDALSSDKTFKIARIWFKRDPDSFIRWVRGRPNTFSLQEVGHGLGFASMIIAAMVEEDPEEAWEAVGSLPGDRESRRIDLLVTLIEKYPARALELVWSHRDEVSVASAGGGRWGRVDPLATLPIINELPPGRGRISIVRDAAMFYTHATEQHAESEIWFAQLTPELRKHALSSLELYRSRRTSGFEELHDSWEQIAIEAGDPP